MNLEQIIRFFNAATRTITLWGGLTLGGPLTLAAGYPIAATIQALVYGVAVAWDASLGTIATLTVTNNTAFAISAPTNLTTGAFYQITISNTSGGAHGTGTWNAIFKTPTGTVPAIADTKNRTFTFYYNGTNLIQVNEPTLDVAN